MGPRSTTLDRIIPAPTSDTDFKTITNRLGYTVTYPIDSDRQMMLCDIKQWMCDHNLDVKCHVKYLVRHQ